jgi:hypothetical protein
MEIKMKAIRTKYHGPTNVKGSRIIADDGDGNRIILSRDCSLSIEDGHRAAAEALCAKMQWSGKLQGGWHKDAYYWVFV